MDMVQSDSFWTSNESKYFANEYIYKCLLIIITHVDKGGDVLRLLQEVIFLIVQLLEMHISLLTRAFRFCLKGYVQFWKFGLNFWKNCCLLFWPRYPALSRRLDQTSSEVPSSQSLSVILWCKWWLSWQTEKGTSPLDVVLIVCLPFGA